METATATPAPTSTPTPTPTPAAAPATSAPSAPTSPEQRPTFAQAFAADAAREKASASASGDAPATAAPEQQPPTPSVTPAPEKKGPIPFDVHETALKNARAKEREAALAEWRQKHGWAEQIPQEQLQAWGQFANRITTDRVGLIRDLVSESIGDPGMAQSLRSELGRMFSSLRGAPRVDANPDVEVVDANGRVVERTFSAQKQLAIIQQTIADALGKEIAPLKQESAQRREAEQRQQAEASAKADAEAMTSATDNVVDEIDGILGITDRETADAKSFYMAVHDLMQADPGISAHKAAIKIRDTVVKPWLEGKAKQQVVDELTTKAAAQSVNPGSTAASATKRPRSFYDKDIKW